jgi:hypothetical protein
MKKNLNKPLMDEEKNEYLYEGGDDGSWSSDTKKKLGGYLGLTLFVAVLVYIIIWPNDFLDIFRCGGDCPGPAVVDGSTATGEGASTDVIDDANVEGGDDTAVGND